MTTLVTIATYHSLPKAEAARLLLAHNGIEAVLSNESIVAMDWLLMNAIGGIKLQTSSQDAERATKIIDEYEFDQRERLKSQATEFIRFKCSECEAPQQFTGDRRGGVETCKDCGQFIDVPDVSDEQMIEQHLTVDAAPNVPGVSMRRLSLPVEVGCVLSFGYLPLLISAILSWPSYDEAEVDLGQQMTASIVTMLNIVPPLLFIIAVSNEPWSKFGITKPRWIADSFFAIGICFLSISVMAMTMSFLLPERGEEVARSGLGYVGWGTVLLCFVGLTANSIAEELAMRGYLIPRFEELFKSPVIAVGLSSALFASYHIYQGVQSVIAIFMFGIVYGIFFCLLRRLWPLVIAHTLTNALIHMNM